MINSLGISPWALPWILAKGRSEMKRQIKNIPLFEDWKPVLPQLVTQGYRLGILTSNSTHNVRSFLRHHQIQHFEYIVSSASLWGKARRLTKLLRSYDLSHSQILYVGDETRDVDASKNLGIQVVAVSWGFYPKEVLKAHGADYCIDHPQELLTVLAENFTASKEDR